MSSAVFYMTHIRRCRSASNTEMIERIVQDLFIAIMLLDVTWLQNKRHRFKKFTYQVHNPLVVNKLIVIKGRWVGAEEVDVWAESVFDGTVGMTGKITMWGEQEKGWQEGRQQENRWQNGRQREKGRQEDGGKRRDGQKEESKRRDGQKEGSKRRDGKISGRD